jgi:hypothetical protein
MRLRTYSGVLYKVLWEKILTKEILYLSMHPTFCRFVISGSNQEEELLDTRLNPQYLFHKHCTEINKHRRVTSITHHKHQAQPTVIFYTYLFLGTQLNQ